MYISPVNSINYSNTPAFKANINGIKLPKNAEKEILKLENALKAVIGHEMHLSKTQIGNKTAVYNKYSASFDLPIDDKSSVSVVTYDKKIHSIFVHNTVEEKNGAKVVKSFDLYNGCKTAINPVPSISYCEHEVCKPLSGFDYHFNQGSEIDRKSGKLIENLLSVISNKLGI